jgi:subtilisin family serine protease
MLALRHSVGEAICMTRIIIRAALVAAIISSFGSFAQAQGPSGNPVVIDMRAAATAREAGAAALLRKANERGQVRVIVGLTMALRPAESLSPVEAAVQANNLRAAQSALAARIGVAPASVTTFDVIPFVSMWVNAAQLTRLVNDLGVVNIQEDVPGTAGLNVSAPFIQAKFLWQQNFAGSGFTVAVLDTGVDKNHPMLKGKVISEACYSTNNAAQHIFSFCPGGVIAKVGAGTGMPCPGNLEPCWHGTHVAGIAVGSAVRHGTAWLRGVGSSARLIAIKVFSKQNNDVVTFSTDWIRGLQRVYQLRTTLKIAAVNMSLGFGEFKGPCDANNPAATNMIRALRNVGIAVLVASMNDSKDNATRSPACITEAIAVGATGRNNNTIANFSNHAPWVRLMAPGVDIISARATGTTVNGCVNKGLGHCASSGTSMATPHVAGAFAMLRDVRTNFTVDDIAAALECTGTLTTRAGISKPRVNLLAAKNYLLSPPRTILDFQFTSTANPPGWFWPLLGGNNDWQSLSGSFQVRFGSSGYKVAAVPNCNEGVNITAANLWRVGPNPENRLGIIFKAQFSNATNISGYFAGYNRQNQGIIRRLDNYNLATDTGTVVQLCTGAVTLNSNNFNTVRVNTRGGVHTLLVNNKVVCVARDRGYGTGAAGVFAYFGSSTTQNGFAVDRFIIQPAEVVASASPANELIVATVPHSETEGGVPATRKAGD